LLIYYVLCNSFHRSGIPVTFLVSGGTASVSEQWRMHMKKLLWLFVWAGVPTLAQNYIITAPHLTMHVGDPVPPCPILVIDQTSGQSVGEGNTVFAGSGYASCTIGATSSSPVGTYPITVSSGTITPKSGGTVTAQNSSINVIAADTDGAKLTSVTYPPGFTSAPAFPMLNVRSNPICNMVSDNGATDNTPCLQNLLAYGGLRAKAGATVTTNGTAVTQVNIAGDNMDFTTMPAGTSIKINGTAYTVASVTSSTALTLTTSAGTQTDVLLIVPTTVNTSGTTVTETNGVTFTGLGLKATSSILIHGVVYTVSSVTDATHLVTTTSLPTQTNVAFYDGTEGGTNFGRSPMYLYFPSGIYWISARVLVYGNYWTLIGDGPQKSTIKLAPNSPEFNTGSSAVSMITAVSINQNGNFSEVIQNMGFRIGQGNPLASAIQWTNNNMGTIRNVQIWSEDSNAKMGVFLGETFVGPTLLKDVAIYGTQTALYATSPNNEYNLTGDEITLEGQQTQAILANMATSFQHVLSDNAVPAFNSTTLGRSAMIDSELLGTNSSATAITIAHGNELYFKNVSCSGYGTCESDDGTGTVVTRATLPSEGWTGTAQTIFDSGSTAGSLPISNTETPIPVDPAASTWTMLGSDPTTWCASITGSISTTVYLPPGTYTSSANVSCTIPDTVNHILMYDSKNAVSSSGRTYTFTVAGSSTTPLVIDGCMHQACSINHTGSRTVAIRDTNGGYQAAPGAGNVYFEDAAIGGYMPMTTNEPGPTFYSSQLATGRQLNIEVGSASDPTLYPKIQCQGANMWLLGYKTEHNSPSIIETAHCQADIYGFYYYNTQAANTGSAPMVLTDSSLFATGFNNWNVAGYGSTNWVNETRSGVAESLAMPGSGNSFGQALNMFYSYGANP
jgi:hypothetical protein